LRQLGLSHHRTHRLGTFERRHRIGACVRSGGPTLLSCTDSETLDVRHTGVGVSGLYRLERDAVKTMVTEEALAILDRQKAAGEPGGAARLFDASTLRHSHGVRAAATGPKYNA